MFVDITPLDTLFVRDGRSFGVNEAHAVDSLFPPPPSTVFGVLRGALLVNGGYAVCKWGGELTGGDPPPDWFGGFGDSENECELRQEGPVIRIGNTPLFPMPLDIRRSEKEFGLLPLRQVPENLCGLSLPYGFFPSTRPPEVKEKENLYVTGDVIREYLDITDWKTALERDRSREFEAEELWESERRVNVSMDPAARAGMEGALFSLEHARMNAEKKVGLICRWRGPSEFEDLLQRSISGKSAAIVNIGGERRLATVMEHTGFSWPASKERKHSLDSGSVFFRLYFATPAYFENGWKPGNDPNGQGCLLKTEGMEIPAELLAAAVGKYRCIGGYDFKHHRERAMHRFVPEGSVYYFKTSAANLENVLRLDGRTIGDSPYFRIRGYGLAFVGCLADLEKTPFEG